MSNKVTPDPSTETVLVDKGYPEHADDDELASPIATELYEMLMEPTLTAYGRYYFLFLCSLVVIRVVAMGLESCDGPNQYYHREVDLATYPALLTEPQYFLLYCICMCPILFDIALRMVLLVLISTETENRAIWGRFKADKLCWTFLVFDTLSILPFLITAAYIHPQNIRVTGGIKAVLALIELGIVARIYRFVRHVPSIRVISTAMGNSFEHLILPLFFFFVFNITTAVIFYFAEPCYRIDVCPWVDLLEATFYSIVTMTTTGYGNQTPSYEIGRFAAVLVMLFGAVFLSMPLAILGNEYDKAWQMISEETRLAAASASAAAQPAPARAQTYEEKRVVVSQHPCMVLYEKLLAMVQGIDGEEGEAMNAAPTAAMVIVLADLRAWMGIWVHQLGELANSIGQVGQAGTEGRRPSLNLLGHKPVVEEVAESPTSVYRKKMISTMKIVPEEQEEEDSELSGSLGSLGSLFSDDEEDGVQGQAADEGERSPPPPAEHSENSDDQSESDIEPDEQAPVIVREAVRAQSAQDMAKALHAAAPSEELAAPSPTQPLTLTASSLRNRVSFQADNRVPFQEAGDAASGSGDSKDDENRPITPPAPKQRFRSHTQYFNYKLTQVTENPSSLKTRIWCLLELPQSSTEARLVQLLVISMLVLSILLLFTQTMTSYTLYGEQSEACEYVNAIYCSDKTSIGKDPGCYVYTPLSASMSASALADIPKVRYFCTDGDCFGHGNNFGSRNTTLTCTEPSTSSASSAWLPPFQTYEELFSQYTLPSFFPSRTLMHRSNPICTRIECVDNSRDYVDISDFWIIAEFVINCLFTVEILLRFYIAESCKAYVTDKINVIDWVAIVPFYIDVCRALARGKRIDFSILSSSAKPIFFVAVRSFKVLRLLKLNRQYRLSKVLWRTAKRVTARIIGMTIVLAFIVVLLSILLYNIERGDICYVGDADCLSEGLYRIGERIQINKDGNISQFSNIFTAIWFSFVTLTTCGYGDIVPVTTAGKFLAVCLMVCGIFYMAMPLTAAASTFYAVHEEYNIHHHQSTLDSLQKQLIGAAAPVEDTVRKDSIDGGDKRLLVSLAHKRGLVSLQVKNISTFLNSTSSDKLMSELCQEVEEALRKTERDVVELLYKLHTDKRKS